MSNNLSIIELLSDDDDDDDILRAQPIFTRRPSPTRSSGSGSNSRAESQVIKTPIGYVNFSYVTNASVGAFGDEVTLVRENDSYVPNAIMVMKGQQRVGVIDHDEAKLLVPILERLEEKVGCTAVLQNPASWPKIVKVDFHALHSRKLSRFELQPLERQINFYLKGKKVLTKTIVPRPTIAQASTAIKADPALSTENQLNNTAVAGAAPEAAAASLAPQAWIKLGHWTCWVVGTRHFKGGAKVGEGTPVQLVREPDNRHDENAIRVDKDGTPVGHIRTDEAEMLAPVLDSYKNSVELECKVQSRESAATKALEIHFKGSRSAAHTLQKLLVDHLKGFKAEELPGNKERSSEKKHSHNVESVSELCQTLLAQAVEMSHDEWEAQKDALDDMFDEQARSQIAQLPLYTMPALLTKNVDLFQHQIDGIRWLVHQEQQVIPTYFEKEPTGWRCKITKTLYRTKPDEMRGGILADDMGLGKTLQTLGLIVSNPPKTIKSYPRKNRSIGSSQVPVCTLIISPLTVISNWEMQIHQHLNQRVENKNLQTLKYHGLKREDALLKVKQGQVDVLMASYHTLASDYKKWKDSEDDSMVRITKKQRKAPYIFEMEFHRVILDEAHIVRSSSTGLWKAVMSLQAERKLCLTGTPFVNKPTDIHSLLSFLKVQPLCRPKVFEQMVAGPIKAHKEIGLATVRTTMAHVALRRKKEQVVKDIQMVEKTVHTQLIHFPEGSDHQKTYNVLYNLSRNYFLKLLNDSNKKTVFYHFMELLALVLRIRQSCCHMSLVPKDYRERAAIGLEQIENGGELGREEGEKLLEYLTGAFKESHLVECAVCLNEMEEDNAIILRDCKHIFCEPCLNQIQNATCPLCRQSFSPDDMIKKQVAESAIEKFSAKSSLERHGRSPKIQALMNLIDELKPDEKGVIFSQWTSVLDIVQLELQRVGHTFTRIDGKMDAEERTDAMYRFDTEGVDTLETPRFILCSLMACGTGINLTRGNVVFMMDPWWNAAAENQAMDRVHRIGQKRPVRVYRLLMKDSIEERMVTLQLNKLLLGKGSMEKLKDEEKRMARLTQLMDLFAVQDEETRWH